MVAAVVLAFGAFRAVVDLLPARSQGCAFVIAGLSAVVWFVGGLIFYSMKARWHDERLKSRVQFERPEGPDAVRKGGADDHSL